MDFTGQLNIFKTGFFDDSNLNYFLPEILFLSDIHKEQTSCTKNGLCYAFTVCLTYFTDFKLCFKTLREAITFKTHIINHIIQYWGPDHVICINPYYEVTIVSAISDLTEIFQKGNRYGFSYIVKNVPYPVTLIFLELCQAEQARKNIEHQLENYHRNSFKEAGLVAFNR